MSSPADSGEAAAIAAVQALVNATNATSRGRVIEAHAAAFRGTRCDTIIAIEMDRRRGVEESIVYFEDCRALLAAWRHAGLDAAVARRAPLDSLRGVRLMGEGPERATYEIAIAREVLTLLDPEYEPVSIAVCRHALASALMKAPDDEPTRTEMLAEAMTALGEAIPVYEQWALIDRWLDAHSLSLDAAAERFRDGGDPAEREAAALLGATAGRSLSARFYKSRDPSDGEAAQSVLERAFELADEGGVAWRESAYGIGLFHHTMYESTGDPRELDRAVDAIRAAVDAASADSERRQFYRTDLALVLHDRYDAAGRISDLDEALALVEALLAEAGDTEDAANVLRLGMLLHARYWRTWDRADIDASVDCLHRAVAATEPGTEQYYYTLGNLGVALTARFDSTGDLADADGAVDTLTAAMSQTPEETLAWAFNAGNLGHALLKRFGVSRYESDLEEAVRVLRDAVRATPEHAASRPRHDAWLADGLTASAKRFSSAADAAEAVAVLENAATRTPAGSPRRADWLALLGAALRVSAALGDPTALDRAEVPIREALAAVVPGTPAHTRYLTDLGWLHADLYARTAQDTHYEHATTAFEQALAAHDVEAWPDQALTVSRSLGDLYLQRGDWTSAARVLGIGADAVQLADRRQLLLSGRDVWLDQAKGIFRDAAYALARVGRSRDAAVLLERGRARQLGDVLARERTNVDALRAQDADVWDRYTTAVEGLRRMDGQQRTFAAAAEPHTVTEAAELRARAAHAWTAMRDAVAAVRRVPGFEDFLAEPEWDDIAAAATGERGDGGDGDVALVYLATTSVGGLALIVGASDGAPPEPTVLLLDALRNATLAEVLQPLFAAYAERAGGRDAWHAALTTACAAIDATVMTPLLAALAPRDIRRVVLIPAGFLALLPLHVAALDRVTVRYAPAARTLAVARRLATKDAPSQLLAIDEPMPITCGGPLEASAFEVASIARRFASPLVLRHEEATRARVLAALDDASILHLSCHGTTDWRNPMNSGLLLANDELLTVRQLMERKHAGARLASLSACETGMVGADIPDEMVMLPTALLQAGFAGILASLWSVPALSTALLMDCFYAHWASDGVEPGAALRSAQRWLRDVTASELAERFRVDSDAADGDHRDALRDLWLEFAAMEPDERPYAHAVHWAAFTFTGV